MSERDEFKAMFEDAVRDMSAIDEALGIDPDEAGGAEPILSAIEDLKAERDALRKDAERYRWIRDTGRLKLGPVIGPRGGKYRAIISGIALGAVSAEIETLDEAIAAIAAKEPK